MADDIYLYTISEHIHSSSCWESVRCCRTSNMFERTVLHHAIMSNVSGAILESLLSQGLNVNVRDILGTVPLCYAIRRNAFQSCIILIKYGANVHLYNDLPQNIYTPALAISSHALLIAWGYPISKCNSHGKILLTPESLDVYLTASRDAAYFRRYQAANWWFTRNAR
jgi:hypothetical protein